MKTSAKVAVACGCAIISSSAFAASRASASISELHFQVVDLDPTDGYTFQFESIGKTVLSLVASGTSSGESDSFGRIRTGWLVPGVFESQIDYVPVQARIDADGISLTGRADAGGGYNAEGAVGQDIPWNSGNLSLSGQTMLIVTAYAKVSVEATNPTGCDSSAGYCSASEVATAWASMQMSYSYATETTGVSSSFNDGLRLEAFATPAHTREDLVGYVYEYVPGYGYTYRPVFETVEIPLSEEAKEQEKTFTAVFVNTSDRTQVAALRLNAGIYGAGTTPLTPAPQLPAVPEPERWLMALAGLGLVGFSARKVRRLN